MNVHTLRADHSEQVTHTQEGLRQRVTRWLKAAPGEHYAPATGSAPEMWREIAGRPYVIGPGTLLVMMYMRKRMR